MGFDNSAKATLRTINGGPCIDCNVFDKISGAHSTLFGKKCLLEWPEDILWATLFNVDDLFFGYYFTFSHFSLGVFGGRCAILCSVMFDFLANKLVNVVFLFKIDLKALRIKNVNQSCGVVILTNRRN